MTQEPLRSLMDFSAGAAIVGLVSARPRESR